MDFFSAFRGLGIFTRGLRGFWNRRAGRRVSFRSLGIARRSSTVGETAVGRWAISTWRSRSPMQPSAAHGNARRVAPGRTSDGRRGVAHRRQDRGRSWSARDLRAEPLERRAMLTGIDSVEITGATGILNGRLNADDVVSVTVTTSETVTVTGTPQLKLNIGGVDRFADYQPGGGSAALVFSYTIQNGDTDTDGISIDADSLSLNDGTIKDGADSDITLTHTSVSDNSAYLVDTAAPTVSSVEISSATNAQNSTLNAGDVISVTVTMTEDVTVTTTGGTPTLTLNVGGTNRTATYSSGSGSTAIVFTYEIEDGDTDTDGISIDADSISLNSGTIQDAAGNNATLAHLAVTDNVGYKVDTTAPDAPLITSVTDDDGSVTGPLTSGGRTDDTNLTVRVSLAGTNAVAGDTVQLYNSTTPLGSFATLTTKNITDGSADVATGSLTNGTYELNAKVIDIAGNASDASTPNFTVTVDSTAPAAPSITSVTDDIGSSKGQLETGDSTDDTNLTVRVSLAGTNAVAGDTVQLYDSTTKLGSAYTLLTADITNGYADVATGTLTNGTTYALNAKVIDIAGNASVASSPNVAVTVLDTTAPTMSATGLFSVAQAASIGTPLYITCTFDEPVVINTTNGTPWIQLTFGDRVRKAEVDKAASFDRYVVFRYDVQPLDLLQTDEPYNVGSINLDGGTIRDAAGNNANLVDFANAPTAGSQTLSIHTGPLVTVNAPAAGKTFKLGEVIEFTAQFALPVTIGASGTPPTIEFTLGGVQKKADYVGSSGTNILKFTYAVAKGDLDRDGIVLTGAIKLGTATLTDQFNGAPTAAVTTFTPPDTSKVRVDGTETFATPVNPVQKTYNTDGDLVIFVTFNDVVTVTTGTTASVPTLPVTIAGRVRQATYDKDKSSDQELAFTYTIKDEDISSGSIKIGSINLNGSTIRDSKDVDATVTYPDLTATGIVINRVRPEATVTKGADKTSKLGDAIEFSVKYSQPVTVAGTPTIGITVGSTNRTADCVDGTGTDTLIFRYVVQSGDLDIDGIAIPNNVITLPSGASITDAGGTPLLTFDPVTTSGVKVDATSPTVTLVSQPAAGTYASELTNKKLSVTVQFSEPVTVDDDGGTPFIPLTIRGLTRFADYDADASSGRNVVFSYTLLDTIDDAFVTYDSLTIGAIDLDGGTIRDSFGNDATLTFNSPTVAGVVVNRRDPKVTFTGVFPSPDTPAHHLYKAGEVISLAVKFALPVTVTGTPTIGITIGSNRRDATFISGTTTDTLLFQYTVTNNDVDPDGCEILSGQITLGTATIKDAAGTSSLTFTPPSSTTVTVDGKAPTVTAVVVPAAQSYSDSDKLTVKVTFSEKVTVSEIAGKPFIPLTINGVIREAEYVDGTGTKTLEFEYTVQNDDFASGSLTIGAIDVDGETIRDTAGNDATLAYNTAPTVSGVFINREEPSVVVSSGADKIYKIGEKIVFTATFDLPVTVTGKPTIGIVVGSKTTTADYDGGTETDILTFAYTVVAGDIDTDGIVIPAGVISLPSSAGIVDSAGNPTLTFAPPDTTKVLVDGVLPTVTAVTVPMAGTYLTSKGDKLEVTVTFSEAVQVDETNGTPFIPLTINGLTRNAMYDRRVDEKNVVFSYTVDASDVSGGALTVGQIALNLGTIRDAAGNDATLTFTAPAVSGVVVNRLPPTITVSSGDKIYKLDDVITFKADFEQVVTGTPTLAIKVGSKSTTADYEGGTGSKTLTFTYKVAANDLDTNGISFQSATIGGTVKDAAGDVPTAFLSFEPPVTTGVTVDGIIPTVLSATGPDAGIYRVSTGDTLDVTVTFSEAVAVDETGGTPFIALTFNGVTRNAKYAGGTGTDTLVFSYSVQSTDISSGSLMIGQITLNGGIIADEAGNPANLDAYIAPTASGVIVNRAPPTVTVSSGPDKTYKLFDVIEFTARYEQPVTVVGSPTLGLLIDSPSTPNVVRTAVYDAMSSSTTQLTFKYTVQATDLDVINGIGFQSPATITLPTGASIRDAIGNVTTTFTAPDTAKVLVDGVRPTISRFSSTTPDGFYKTGTINITATVSEPVQTGATFTVTLNTGATVTLNYDTATTLVGTYAIAAGEASSDLAVASYTVGTVLDLAGNAMTGVAVPAGNNISDSSDIVVDSAGPTIASVAITSATGIQNGTLSAGDVVSVTVTMSEATLVTGNPRLALDIGGTTVQASYSSALSGPTTLVFTYTILAGQADPTGISIAPNSLSLNGGTMTDAAGNDAVLTHTAVADNANYKVDTTDPTVSNVAITSATGIQGSTLNAGDVVSVTVTMSEPTTVTGVPQLAIKIGGATVLATYATGSGSTALVFNYTILAGQTDTDGISIAADSLSLNGGAITDLAGNPAVLTHPLAADNAAYKVDTTAPNAPSLTSVTDAAGSITGPLISGSRTDDTNLTVRVSLTGTGAVAGDTIQFYNSAAAVGSAYALLAGDITNGYADVAVGTLVNGTTYALNAKVIDIAGNPSPAWTPNFAVTVDTTSPNAPSITSVTDDVGGITGPLTSGGRTDDTNLTVRVSLAGTNAVAGDTVQLHTSASALGTPTTLTIADVATGYVDVATGALSNATAYALNAKVIDIAGNASAASGNFNVTVDTTASNAPSITSVTDDVGSVTGPLTSGDRTDDTNLLVRVALPTTGSLAVAGDTVQLYNSTTPLGSFATLTTKNITDGYADVATGTITNGTTYALNAKVIDIAGNASVASSPNVAVTVDTTPPSAPSIASVTDDAGSIAGPLTSGGRTDDTNLMVRVALPTTGSLAVAGDTVQLYNSTTPLGSFATLTPSNITNGYVDVATGTLTNGTTYAINAKVIDIAGNASVASSPNFTVTVDTTAPTVSGVAITSGTGAQSGILNAGDVVSVTVTMSEATTVTGVPQLALKIGGTTVQASYASGYGTTALVFTYTILAGQTDTDGISIDSNAISLNAGTIRDLAGNPAVLTHAALPDNAAYKVDTTAPAVSSFSSTTAPGAYKAGDLIEIAATMTEPVQAGATITVTLDNGAVVTLTAATEGTMLTGTYSVDAGDTSTSSLTVQSYTADAVLDIAGNPLTDTTVPLAENNIPGSAAIVIDTVAPTIKQFYASPLVAEIKIGESIELRAEVLEPVRAGGTIEVTLNTGAKVLLTAASDGVLLVGAYTVRPGDSTDALTVESFRTINGPVLDIVGNPLTTDLPALNLAVTSSVRVSGAIAAAGGGTSSGFSSVSTNVPERKDAVRTIPITFNTAVRGLTLASLRLFLNNRAVSLQGATLKGSGKNWTVTLPSGRASLKGIYELRILPTNVTAVANGAAMSASSSLFWGFKASVTPLAARRP
jgi:hypothetical protein